ncbi:MAG: ABC transporter ATP-binding protein [Ilumatobacteraceae bacterium]
MIELDQLARSYGEVVAVDRLSLTIDDGEFVALLGPSGCGKSTILRMLAGLLEPTGGRVLLDGDDITYQPPRDRDLAMVFQSYALYPHLDVRSNLAFGLKAHHVEAATVATRVTEVAEQLGLAELLDRKPRELSGGQRQRVAVGRAIARRPRAFLMDEPLSNLDARLRTATRRELVALHRQLQATIVYVTHDQVEAMTMATKIVVMNHGRIEQVGSPLEVYDQPATTFVAGFLGSPPMNLIDATVCARGGNVVCEAPGVRLAIAEGSTVERPIVFGVRPEEISAGDVVGPDDRPFADGVVSLVENLGGEEIAYVDVGGQTIAVRSPRGLGPVEGRATQLHIDPRRVHLFDRDSGHRLRWSSPPSTAKPAPAVAAVGALSVPTRVDHQEVKR